MIESINEDRFLVVRKSTTELREHDLYKELEGLVVQGKHRGLKEPVISINYEENKSAYSYNLNYPSFAFNDKLQSEREFQEFLSPIYAVTSKMTVRTGILINQILSK
ncbi:MAG: hypothetical protein V9G21_09840 [Methylotenera sp.]|nr:hypothetical protein [Methylotenera sp.]HPH08851.1 hypothetical protein [Methylotenera sp.]HPM49804.1 hypothetical protein [Methylotenera sp.]